MTKTHPKSLEQIKVNLLIPYARNAKKHDIEQVSKIAGSIREFGFNNPILIDGELGIIAGHGRVLAAQKLGLESVPCLRLLHLSETQKRAYILADNKLAELGGGWDEEMLGLELEELREQNFDLSIVGFENDLMESGLNLGDKYTAKIESPVYEMKGENPEVETLVDCAAAKKLEEEIKASENISSKDKAFLILAAQRHLIFNYENIAEFYAHANKSTQHLMEKSALVIIDYDKAIEYGFVKFSESLDAIANIDTKIQP